MARFCDRGDARAFDTLVRRHRESVFRLALSVLGPGGEAEEVAQEAFLRAHRSLRAFRREAKFASWLYRIAFNLALNVKARARHRTPHVPYDALDETLASSGDPGDAVDGIGREQMLSECLSRLPEVYQAAVRLHYGMDHSVAEVAELLGAPVNTVKSYLYRARLLLRALLEERGYEDA